MPAAGERADRRRAVAAAEGLTYEGLIAALLFVGIAAAACLMPAQSDTFWQLRSGHEMVSTGRILLADTFTHTVPGVYWPNHEWLSHALFYLLWAAGGFPLLTAFAAALIAGSWVCMWRLMRGSVLVNAALVLAVLVPAARLWSLRPHVISLFLLAAAVLLSRTRPRLLPLLFLLWANFHGGVMVGLAAIGGLLGGVSIVERFRWRESAAILAACAAAVCVTPLGVSIWTEIPQMLQRLALYDVQEWRPASLLDPMNAPFWAAALALLVLPLHARRQLDVGTAALLGAALAVLPLAVKSTRNIAPFLLLAAPALSHLVPASLVWTRRGGARNRGSLHLAIAGGTTAASIALVAYAWARPLDRLNWAPVSQEIVRTVATCPGNIYNRYDEGGYLIWFAAGKPVFMDSRQDPFPTALVTAQIETERTGDYGRLFAAHEIRCAALPPHSRVARQLVADGWHTRAADRRWIVLVEPGSDRVSRSAE
jgi:hypothetical protein